MDAAMLEWAGAALACRGLDLSSPFEPVKIRPWASVLRASTSAGVVYLKANAPGGRHEPALVEALARDWPDRVPVPFATEPQRGWLLTPDHGRRLDEALPTDQQLATWEDLLPRYAEIQLASAAEPERWLALGVPDRRLERLPALASTLVGGHPDLDPAQRGELLALLPQLESACRALAELPLGATLEHGDLHGANVLVGRGGCWFFDWADASVSHPFFTLLVTVSMLVQDPASEEGRRVSGRLRDAYLEPWSDCADVRTLREVFPVALWVAHLGRALDWQHMLTGAEGPGLAEWAPHLVTWLQRWHQRRSWASR